MAVDGSALSGTINNAWSGVLQYQWYALAQGIIGMMILAGLVILLIYSSKHQVRVSVRKKRNSAVFIKDLKCRAIKKTEGTYFIPMFSRMRNAKRYDNTENLIPVMSRFTKWSLNVWEDENGNWQPYVWDDTVRKYVTDPQDLRAEYSRSVEIAAQRKVRTQTMLMKMQPFVGVFMMILFVFAGLIALNKFADINAKQAEIQVQLSQNNLEISKSMKEMSQSIEKLGYVLSTLKVVQLQDTTPPANAPVSG